MTTVIYKADQNIGILTHMISLRARMIHDMYASTNRAARAGLSITSASVKNGDNPQEKCQFALSTQYTMIKTLPAAKHNSMTVYTPTPGNTSSFARTASQNSLMRLLFDDLTRRMRQAMTPSMNLSRSAYASTGG